MIISIVKFYLSKKNKVASSQGNTLLILIEIPFLLIKNRYLIILIFRNIFFNRNIAYEIFQNIKIFSEK